MRKITTRSVGRAKGRNLLFRRFVFLFLSILIAGAPSIALLPSTAISAARLPDYRAFETSRSPFGPIVLTPGQTKTLTITFKNTGAKTWTQAGNARVAINTSPIGRISKFRDSSWTSAYRPARPNEQSIPSNATATFSLTIKAPITKGEYIERFSLARVGGEIAGGDFELLINVAEKNPTAPLYAARITGISENAYSFKPDEGKTLWVEVQNTGRATWRRQSQHPLILETATPRLRTSEFTLKWITPGHPNYVKEKIVKPGERVKVYFALRAPKTDGAYTESFALVAKGMTAVAGSQFDLQILVRDPDAPVATIVGGIPEPTIRVGITYLNDGITLKPNSRHTYALADGTKLIDAIADTQSDITFTNGKYTLKTPTQTFTSTQAIRVTPDAPGVTAVVNYRTNFDTFRGIIEVRWAEATKRLWVINELPLDSYMAGLAEAVNGQHSEYMKTLAISARSYALWHWYVSSKHKTENYIINSTTDQVYRGYNYELKTPDFVAAVNATRGIVMTHPSAGFDKNPLNIALGAYSSGTDGRTRSFTEVWGGRPEDWEWMVSVPDPLGIIPDALTRPGNHMVGMSATGALRYAVRENKKFDWILQHYYTGITLKQLWQ